ncbi:MAG: hypothetical protein QXX74_03440 [Candidatus Micrarchaeaceae archaeon]
MMLTLRDKSDPGAGLHSLFSKANPLDSMPILAGYKHEKIEAYISAQKRLKNSTKIIFESELRGTGSALKNADSVRSWRKLIKT